MTNNKTFLLILLVLVVAHASAAQGTRLLRHPTVSRALVAFSYAGDLWVVARSGGQARRLISTPGVETDPYFSPDGSQIAFSATVAGNTDVYVMPTDGGNPKRLTYHPVLDRVNGWSPDGRRIVFASVRTSAPLEAHFRLWTIDAATGGLPEPLALPRGLNVMVQVQSRWFPVVDRNPQKFVPNTFLAKDSDFQQATQRVYRSGQYASHIAVPVVVQAQY